MALESGRRRVCAALFGGWPGLSRPPWRAIGPLRPVESLHRVGGRRCPSAGCGRCPGLTRSQRGKGWRVNTTPGVGSAPPHGRWSAAGRWRRRTWQARALAPRAVAIKSKAAPAKTRAEPLGEERARGPRTPPLPLLDLSDAAVKEGDDQAGHQEKAQAMSPMEQLNAVMPSEEVTSTARSSTCWRW